MAKVLIKDLVKIYRDLEFGIEIPALKGINLEIKEGEITGIFGPSGAGKTTLLTIIGGMLQPTSGKVYIDDDIDITSFSEKDLVYYRREQIGYLWQLPEDNLINEISVLKNVMLPMQITNTPREEQNKRANELLDMVSLSHRKDHKPNQISGGEAQRASIAVALANNPEILLGDQITGELDTETSNEVVTYLHDLNEQFGTTMIIATHKKQFIDETDCSYGLRDGRIANIITKGSVVTAEMVKEIKEEYVVISQDGTVVLPTEILTEINFDSKYKAEFSDGIIKLIPLEKCSKVLEEE
jgi:ABC-type lipoprotein export system ATPase subunit